MSIKDDVEVYAIPGSHSIIDTINHETGLTRVLGQTEAEVIAREPGAVRMTWADWTAAASARQRTPITWAQTTERRYNEMLNVLPPAMWVSGAFLVGEAVDHDVLNGQPRYDAYRCKGEASIHYVTYYHASRPLTCAELRAELGLAPKDNTRLA